MRQAYAHDAVLAMAPEADLDAPGAAITTALCGHWRHDPPCPLAAHHTGVHRDGEQVRLRILFATEPHRVDEVRDRIDAALAAGEWRLVSSACARVAAGERDHARRLLRPRSPGRS
jgi:hypothetical protein